MGGIPGLKSRLRAAAAATKSASADWGADSTGRYTRLGWLKRAVVREKSEVGWDVQEYQGAL